MNGQATRVLLVEDSPSDADVICTHISKRFPAANITHVERLADGLRLLQRKVFNVILLDLGLPDSQGVHTVNSIRQFMPCMPLVVLTGNDEEEVCLQALKAGADAFLIKGEATPSLLALAIWHACDRKEWKRAIRQRDAELARLARLGIVGELGTGLAHELKQPLSTIVNYVGALRQQLDSASSLEVLDWIESEAIRAGEIISKLRQFVSNRQTEHQSLNINRMITTTLSLFRWTTRRQQVRPEFLLDESLPDVWADDVQIQQVLINLIRNAAEAMVDLPAIQRVMTIATFRRSEQVVVEVSDRGRGIEPASSDYIFRPFFSTKNEGLGIGLSICRTIIEAHGGHLSSHSNESGGATFRFTLPVADVKEEQLGTA